MKNSQIFITLIALLLFGSINIKANVKSGNGISADAKFAYSLRPIKGSDKFVLAFNNLTRNKVSIRIYDESDKLVFSEKQSETQELRKSYDLSNLTNGTYTVKIASGEYQFTEEIEIGKYWDELDFDTVIVPDHEYKNKLRVGFANAKGEVSIEIEDEQGNTVHFETFKDAQNANQLFNMEFLLPGIYQVTVTCGEEKVTEAYIVE